VLISRELTIVIQILFSREVGRAVAAADFQ